jgi:hypothetical protein
MLCAPSVIVAKEIDDTYLIGAWAPKARANCGAGKNLANITFDAEHRAAFLDEDYTWYLAEDIVVLKKLNTAEAGKAPPPDLAVIVSTPERNSFNSMFLLVGGDVFAARLFRCRAD